ncbi:hypothetical protein ACMA1I_09265 [Pontibacter sp. 13R65]|uniref:hypothetical protein n=1 Tax=Pontibacter sp. 13R65 TaxID=3127458 RepID=UPI00301C62E0
MMPYPSNLSAESLLYTFGVQPSVPTSTPIGALVQVEESSIGSQPSMTLSLVWSPIQPAYRIPLHTIIPNGNVRLQC